LIETKGSPEAYDARAVANFILDLAERDGRTLAQVLCNRSPALGGNHSAPGDQVIS
jgi:hypothetical protein